MLESAGFLTLIFRTPTIDLKVCDPPKSSMSVSDEGDLDFQLAHNLRWYISDHSCGNPRDGLVPLQCHGVIFMHI